MTLEQDATLTSNPGELKHRMATPFAEEKLNTARSATLRSTEQSKRGPNVACGYSDLRKSRIACLSAAGSALNRSITPFASDGP